MPPEESQLNNQINPDQAAASLAFATQLQQRLMQPQEQPVEGDMAAEIAPEQEQIANPQEDLEQMEGRIMEEIGGLKEMIEQSAPKDKDKEIEELKKQIKEVLDSNE